MRSVAWKILRGALVASTEMVTFGVAADQPQAVMSVTQKIPKTLERFMLLGPSCGRMFAKKIDNLNAVKLKTISAGEQERIGGWAAAMRAVSHGRSTP